MTKKHDDNELPVEIPYLGSLPELPEEDLADLIAAIQEGAESPAEALGFSPEALNSIEQIALSYYRSSLYEQAAKVYGFVLYMDNSRATAWRGLAACCHARKQYVFAVNCYFNAVDRDSRDFVSWIFMGECLCHLGKTKEGLQVLRTAVKKGEQYGADPLYLTRARAIIQADGGIPPKIVILGDESTSDQDATGHRTPASDLSATPHLQPEVSGEGNDKPLYDPTREITVEDMKRNPALNKELQALTTLYQEGKITLAQIGGFSESEMKGAYACACKYVELNDYTHALQIIGWLMFLDPYNGDYFQLLGIIMQRSKNYAAADQYYELADHFAPGNPMTLVYRGETRIMDGDRKAGLAFIRAGVQKAGNKPEHEALVKRARALVRQFG